MRLQQYKDDLLVSCLTLILSLPSEILVENLESAIPAVCTAFKLGPSYLPIVDEAIKALENWSRQLSPAVLLPLLKKALPLLNPFLRTSTTKDVGENSEETTVTVQKRYSFPFIRLPPTTVTGTKSGSITYLTKVKLRIVKLLGSLGGTLNLCLVDEDDNRALESAVSWDSHKHLLFEVPFLDIKPSVYLGKNCF